MTWLVGLLQRLLPAVTVDGDTLDPRVRALIWLGDRRASIHTYDPPTA